MVIKKILIVIVIIFVCTIVLPTTLFVLSSMRDGKYNEICNNIEEYKPERISDLIKLFGEPTFMHGYYTFDPTWSYGLTYSSSIIAYVASNGRIVSVICEGT